jgi:hypothetical protein
MQASLWPAAIFERNIGFHLINVSTWAIISVRIGFKAGHSANPPSYGSLRHPPGFHSVDCLFSAPPISREFASTTAKSTSSLPPYMARCRGRKHISKRTLHQNSPLYFAVVLTDSRTKAATSTIYLFTRSWGGANIRRFLPSSPSRHSYSSVRVGEDAG